jgi:hypothetical protein
MSDLQTRTQEIKDELDAWTREVVQWHFDPETGCPFWLDYASKLDWDPRECIECFDDLKKFGLFDDEQLKGGPIRRWVPKAYSDKQISVFETGGSTGLPKSRISIDDFRNDYSMFSETLPDEFFPKGGDWLSLGPTGPRRLRLAVEYLAQIRGGICFQIDLDPRWVKKLVQWGEMDMINRYKEHCVDQALTILRAHNIRCLFTTPKLLEALCNKVSLKKVGITGVFIGGTEMTPQFHRFAREELLEGAYFAATYGNTLMGLAVHKPFDPADNFWIIYYPPVPRAVLQVVEPEDPFQLVDYNATGRVRLTTLTREFFLPNMLERDEAERVEPIDDYPWDGVANIRPFTGFGGEVVEGVY